ncbi:MAG: zinc-ribbon and FHA domain-containing protein [Actinomycetota bacterium]|nr:zinc-ribbon and FHA domain-containing protein [Actinomycetota bacterium]
MSHVYCPECGFQNPEAANYCARCGARLLKEDTGDATQAFAPVEPGDESALLAEELGIKGPALVVRSGGGRAGETFHPQGDRTTIGRSPDCGIFLDDVTVSRRHAVLVEDEGAFVIEDQESLNGTFVNRRRIDEPTRLDDGDEVQIGKYRLTFLSR